MPLERRPELVTRYFVKGEFNVRSGDQLRAYLESKGLAGGEISTKSGKAKVDKKVLKELAKKNPLFSKILDYKAIDKVHKTYVVGSEALLGEDNRLHGQILHKPSTLRLSMKKPNLTNIPQDRRGKEAPEAGFRKCIISAPGCSLVSADKAAVEAVLVGWFCKDPTYIRLAKLGVHDYLTSHIVKKPANVTWDDAKLGAYLKDIKKKYPEVREKAKKAVHAISYGESEYGMWKGDPELWDLKEATSIRNLFLEVCPAVKKWQDDTRMLAHTRKYLGLEQHPFRYRHWFWDIYSYNNKTNKNGKGADHNRAVAYYGQSTGAALIKEDALLLMTPGENYIGDTFFGQSPIRALIHDDITSEVQDDRVEEVIRKKFRVMTRPIKELPCPPEWNLGPYLTIGVAIKVGKNWGDMKEVDLGELGTASDMRIEEEEEDSE